MQSLCVVSVQYLQQPERGLCRDSSRVEAWGDLHHHFQQSAVLRQGQCLLQSHLSWTKSKVASVMQSSCRPCLRKVLLDSGRFCLQAVAAWRDNSDFGRIQLVKQYFSCCGTVCPGLSRPRISLFSSMLLNCPQGSNVLLELCGCHGLACSLMLGWTAAVQASHNLKQ